MEKQRQITESVKRWKNDFNNKHCNTLVDNINNNSIILVFSQKIFCGDRHIHLHTITDEINKFVFGCTFTNSHIQCENHFGNLIGWRCLSSTIICTCSSSYCLFGVNSEQWTVNDVVYVNCQLTYLFSHHESAAVRNVVGFLLLFSWNWKFIAEMTFSMFINTVYCDDFWIQCYLTGKMIIYVCIGTNRRLITHFSPNCIWKCITQILQYLFIKCLDTLLSISFSLSRSLVHILVHC